MVIFHEIDFHQLTIRPKPNDKFGKAVHTWMATVISGQSNADFGRVRETVGVALRIRCSSFG